MQPYNFDFLIICTKHKRTIKLHNTVGKQITHLAGLRRKFWQGKQVNSYKIKETIHSLKNPNHINKSSCMLHEIWLPNLS